MNNLDIVLKMKNDFQFSKVYRTIGCKTEVRDLVLKNTFRELIYFCDEIIRVLNEE